MGWGGGGRGWQASGKRRNKGDGEKQQRRGQKVGEEGGDMKCEFKFI